MIEGFLSNVSPRVSSKVISLVLAFVITLSGVRCYDVISAKNSAGGEILDGATDGTVSDVPSEMTGNGGANVFAEDESTLIIGETIAEAALICDITNMKIIAKKEIIKVINCGKLSVFASALLVSRAIESGRINENDFAVCPASAQKRPNYLASSPILSVGKKMTVKDILKCMIYQKGSSFAYTLAVHISGSEEAFVSELNTLASELGLTSTAFTNVCGEDDGIAKTSLRDVAVLVKSFLNDARLRGIFTSNDKLTVSSGEADASIYLTVANDFFTSSCTEGQAKADGISGGKVDLLGEKRWAVVLFTRGESEYLVITLGCASPYSEVLKISASVIE